MKLNKLFVAVMTAGVLFSACEQTFTPEPSPAAPENAKAVCFQTPDLTGVEIDPEAGVTEYAIVVERKDSVLDALTVGIVVLQNDNDVFTVPSSVSFAEGQATDTLKVGLGTMDAGITYNLTIQLESTVVNPYAEGAEAAICQLGITPIKWEAGVGIYHDLLVPSGYSSIPVTAWYIDYKIANMPDGTAKICVSAPYAKLPVGEQAAADADGIYDAFMYFGYNTGADDLMLYVDADGVVTFNYYEIGCDFGYGSVFGALYQGGTGVYTPGVSVTFPDGAMVTGEDGTAYAYANFSLYMTKEAYLEATAVDAIEATVNDYAGTFAISAVGLEGEYTDVISVTSVETEEGQLYVIENLAGMETIYGFFDEQSHLMHIPAQELGTYTVEETGAVYDLVLYTVTSDGGTSTKDLVLGYNGDGTVTIHETSETVGVVVVAFNQADENDYGFLAASMNLSLTAVDAPAAASKKVAAMVESGKIVRAPQAKDLKLANK